MAGPFIPYKYLSEETIDYQYFKQFAAQHPESFKNHHEMNYGHYFDVSAITKDGTPAEIELKLREPDAERYRTCYIEVVKHQKMMADYRKTGILPVYINFIGDNKTMYLFRLDRLKHGEVDFSKMIQGEPQDRFGLYWSDAWLYKMQPDGKYKLIKKGL